MKNRLICIVGRKGSGKSIAFVRVLSEAPRVLVWDALAEHSWCSNTIGSIARLDQFMRDMHDAQNGCGRFAVRYVPSSLEEIDAFSRLAFHCSRACIGFEEVPAFSSASSMPKIFERLILQGRHRSLDFVFTAQRFAEVPRTLTAQVDAFILFGASEPLDLQAIESRTSSDFRRAVQELPQYKVLVFDVARREAYPFTPEAARKMLDK